MAVFPYPRNIRRSLLFLLGREIERIALGAAHLGCLFRLCLRDIAGIDRNHAGALLMRRHHHLVGMALVHPEDRLEDQHDEFTGREIVVEQDHLPQRRPLRLRFDLYARLLKRLLAHGEPPAPASRRTCYFAAGAAPIPSNFASFLRTAALRPSFEIQRDRSSLCFISPSRPRYQAPSSPSYRRSHAVLQRS